MFHEALNPLQVELDQHVVKLRALVLPHVNDVLQIGDGELLEALLQEVEHPVSGQGLHFGQIFGEDLETKQQRSAIDTKYETQSAICTLSESINCVQTFRPSSGQIFNTHGENSKIIPRFSSPVFREMED